MIKSTNNYEKFKLRQDNRERGISESHLKKLINSIKSKNLLKLCPILVNENYEIIDGQHRFTAAKNLGLEIYYQVQENMNNKDMILMNVSKPWSIGDYLNYYCKNGYVEYLKLNDFIKFSNLSTKVALYMTMSKERVSMEKFKNGEYVFKFDMDSGLLENCWKSINIITKNNGYSSYTKTSRFWNALVKICQQPNFNSYKWVDNLNRMVDRCGPRTNSESYFIMLVDIYNWRNNEKITIYNS